MSYEDREKADEITRRNAAHQREHGNDIAARCYEAGVAATIVRFLLDELKRDDCCAGCTLEALGTVAGSAIGEMLREVDDTGMRAELAMILTKAMIEAATGMTVRGSAMLRTPSQASQRPN
ncbi:hypothetical protein [Pleomorphomonas koreensis]|uniref:hypothetical protein n=1 Tax=Pleomorphomonas koreensis TaxID=257440 RepID=UPI0004255E32|nr:hypothetical protein [Pleomorphomonas koreensis]